MPISLEPDRRFPIVLDSDKDKPSVPTFYARSQPMRGQESIGEVLSKLHEPDIREQELFEITIAELNRVLIGWENMGGHVFGESDLRDVLNYAEARELLRKVAFNAYLDAAEKKS